MTLIDHSVVVFMALGVHGILLIKTDFFNGQRDFFGPTVRRGPHRKPKPGST